MASPAVARYRRMVVAMKPESVYGTDVFAGTYTSADVISCRDVVPGPNLEEIPNIAMAGDLGRLPSAIGIESASVQFVMWYRGRTAPFDDSPSRLAPEVDLPFRGCGLAGVFSVANGAAFDKLTYSPTNTLESMTIYVVQEIAGQATAPALKITGAFGTFGYTIRAGGIMELRFQFVGAFAGRADVTYVAGVPSPSGAPSLYPVLKSAGLQIDTTNYAPRVAQVGFELGNTVSPIASANAASALAGFFISDRNPRLTIDPEADLVANYDWVTKWRASNLADLDFTLGSTQWNKIKPIHPRVQIAGQGYTQRDGITAWPTALLATINAGLDDVSFECS
jgi:hypothetical protein